MEEILNYVRNIVENGLKHKSLVLKINCDIRVRGVDLERAHS